MGKTITKTVTQALMCRLTEAELEEESRKLTDFLLEKATLEVEKSASNKHYADRIKAVDVRIEKQIPVVRDREIEREVECRVEYNVPEAGLKRITRLDTGEIVETREMTENEKQDLFINAPAAEDAPAAPLGLPAPEEPEPPAEPPALPPPEDGEIIDAEEVTEDAEDVIHVKLDDYIHPITPVSGQLYDFEGVLVRAVAKHESDLTCAGCIIQDHPKCGIICPKCDCEGFAFRPPYEESSPANGESSEPYEESSPERLFCMKCGHNPGRLFHVDNEKLMCENCMENTASASKAAQFLAEPHDQGFDFRAQFGYGCRAEFSDATCFRFRKAGQYGNWGMHHYKPGNYQVEGTPAHEYWQHLKSIGGHEA